jgi:hypothetical protein
MKDAQWQNQPLSGRSRKIGNLYLEFSPKWHLRILPALHLEQIYGRTLNEPILYRFFQPISALHIIFTNRTQSHAQRFLSKINNRDLPA